MRVVFALLMVAFIGAGFYMVLTLYEHRIDLTQILADQAATNLLICVVGVAVCFLGFAVLGLRKNFKCALRQ